MGPSHPRTEGEPAGKTVLAFSSPPFAFICYQGLKLNPWEERVAIMYGLWGLTDLGSKSHYRYCNSYSLNDGQNF